MKSYPIHIVGTGSIGVALAYALARNGADVDMIESDADKCEYGKNHGIVVDGYDAIKVRSLLIQIFGAKIRMSLMK